MAGKLDPFRKTAKHSFCVYPFTHVSFGQGGRINLCCRADFDLKDNLGAIPSDKVWNSELFTRVRKQMMSGERPSECRLCWEMEEGNVTSPRQQELVPESKLLNWFEEFADFDAETGIVKSGVQSLKVYLSNLCNLQCRMCNPEHSTRWQGVWKKNLALRELFNEIDFHDGAFEREWPIAKDYEKEILRFIEMNVGQLREINFVGGEPLIQKEHYQALDLLKGYESKIELSYDTNMTALSLGTQNAIPLWEKFKRVHVYISIDGTPDLFEYIRPGLRTKKVEENIAKLKEQLKLDEKESTIELRASCTFSVYNIYYAPEICEYITGLGLGLQTNQVEFPYFLSPQVLPKHEKEAIVTRIVDFLAHLEARMEPAFAKSPFWKHAWRRRDQLDRIRFHMRDSLNYMNSADQSEHFSKFLKFDHVLNKDGSNHALHDFYPWWPKQMTEVNHLPMELDSIIT